MFTYEYVKDKFKEENYNLLSKEYKNNRTKLKVECSAKHQYEITYSNFQQGHRCPICYNKIKKGLSYSFVKKQIEKENYKLLSNKYQGAHSKLKVECIVGHKYKVTYSNFQQGYRCPICYNNQKGESRKLLYDYVKIQIEETGYKLLSNKYKNVHEKLKIKCFEGHQYEVTYGNFQQNRRCPICWELETHSRSEKDCLGIVRQLTNENVIENDRTQIVNPNTNQFLELDIWIPSINKAIEFNGEYWHGNNYSKYKDEQKVKQCKEKSIDLLIIWYQNWIDDRQEQINNLRRFIGV